MTIDQVAWQPLRKRQLSIAFLSIARSTFDVPLAQSVADAAVASLVDAGYTLVGTGGLLLMDADQAVHAIDSLRDVEFDLLILFQATFADSTMVVDIATSLHDRNVPLLLWAVSDTRDGGRLRLNSLCGINLAAHALKQRGVAYEYLLCQADDPSALATIEPLATAGRAKRKLQDVNIGVIGQHPQGFETCVYDSEDLRHLFGIEVVPMALDTLLLEAAAIDQTERDAFTDRVSAYAANLDELDPVAVAGTAGVYAAMRTVADRCRLAGFAVRCWPEFFTELGCAACGAMSMLNEERCPASCEADVNGTVTSLLLQALSGEQAFIADLVSIDSETDTGVLWHCGLAPVSMADPNSPILGTIHSNRKLPLLFEFPLKPGRVTVARLHRAGVNNGLADYQLVIGGGEMVRAPKSYGGTSGLIRFDRPATDVLDVIMTHGLEHHFSLTYGDHGAALHAFAKLVGLPVIELIG